MCLKFQNIALAVLLAVSGIIITGLPAPALSVEEFFTINYTASFSRTAVQPGETFSVTITGSAYCDSDLSAPYDWVSEVKITGRISAYHSGTGGSFVLNSTYTLGLSPVPTRAGESTSAVQTVNLAFPLDSPAGAYTVSGELIQAKAHAVVWLDVTDYLPPVKTLGSVTCLPAAPATTTPPPASTTPPATTSSLTPSSSAPAQTGTLTISPSQTPSLPPHSTAVPYSTAVPSTSPAVTSPDASSAASAAPSSPLNTFLLAVLVLVWLAAAVTAFFILRKSRSRPPHSPSQR
jgi:hypothetical protein